MVTRTQVLACWFEQRAPVLLLLSDAAPASSHLPQLKLGTAGQRLARERVSQCAEPNRVIERFGHRPGMGSMGVLTAELAAQMKTDAYTECRGVGRIAVYGTETNRIWSRFISRKPKESALTQN